jgi:hypothetical protein
MIPYGDLIADVSLALKTFRESPDYRQLHIEDRADISIVSWRTVVKLQGGPEVRAVPFSFVM